MCDDCQKLRKLLERIREQGLAHQCAMEGFINTYGCDDCQTNLEAEIDEALKNGPPTNNC